MTEHVVEGPFFEDFSVGDILPAAPSVTLTYGHATVHQMLFGDRLRMPIDHPLSVAVAGLPKPLANPTMVIGVAIGQTTYATQNVMGNLFYRGLVLKKPVYIGDTLTTRTQVALLRQNKTKPGRGASGLVVLDIQVQNQSGDEILHFWRCPMVPCRDATIETGHADDLDAIHANIDEMTLLASVPINWNLEAFKKAAEGTHFEQIAVGDVYKVKARDTVSCAPELTRLTLNLAMTHTDATASVYGKRLVYGGHTISIAAAQMLRALPNVVTLLAWRSCDHLAPVFEGDILRSEVSINNKTVIETGGGLVDVRVRVWAERGDNAPTDERDVPVLDWVLVALMA